MKENSKINGVKSRTYVVYSIYKSVSQDCKNKSECLDVQPSLEAARFAKRHDFPDCVIVKETIEEKRALLGLEQTVIASEIIN